MKTADYAPLIAIAMLAARADGSVDSAEQRVVDSIVAHTGNSDVAGLAQQIAAGQLRAADPVSSPSDYEARRAAYEGALAVINADGTANESEQAFLNELRTALGFSDAEVAEATHMAAAKADAPAGPVDEFILWQAILTGAIEEIHGQASTLNLRSPVQGLSNS